MIGKLFRILGLGLGLFVILVLTLAIFGLPLGDSIGAIWNGATGSPAAIARTLVRATPLALCGLGMVVAWRAGMYNIGGEGQYIVGGLTAALSAKLFGSSPAWLFAPMLIFSGIIGGGFYAAIAGWLQVKRGVLVVISTILLNFVALRILDWAVRGPLQEASRQNFRTNQLTDEMMLMKFDRQTDLHLGVFIAAFVVLAIFVYLFWTRSGFTLRLVGASSGAARTHKINSDWVQIKSMFLSGGLCGLAGAVDYSGLIGFVGSGFSQNWGFLAIPVALLGGLHPIGTGISSVFFGGLFAGSEALRRATPIGNTIVPVMQGIAVLGYVAISSWIKLQRPRNEEAQH